MEIIQREETDKFLIWNDLGKPRLRTMLFTPTQSFARSTQTWAVSHVVKKMEVKKLSSWKSFNLWKKNFLTLSRTLWELK